MSEIDLYMFVVVIHVHIKLITKEINKPCLNFKFKRLRSSNPVNVLSPFEKERNSVSVTSSSGKSSSFSCKRR